MHKDSSSLLDAVLDLEEAASHVAQTFRIPRHGLVFERSGDSMAVYDGQLRLDRVTFSPSTEQGFLAAIDAWELARYMGAA